MRRNTMNIASSQNTLLGIPDIAKNKLNLMVWVLGFALTVHSQTSKFA